MVISSGRATGLIVAGGIVLFIGIYVTIIMGGAGLEWLIIVGGIPVAIGIGMLVMVSAKTFQEGKKSAFKNKS